MHGSDGPRILGDFWKKAVSWDLRLDKVSWFLDLGEASPVMDYQMSRVVGSDGTVSIVEIVSFSPRVEKPKSQEGYISFVPELQRVVSVSSISGFLCMWTFSRVRIFYVSYFEYVTHQQTQGHTETDLISEGPDLLGQRGIFS